MKNKHKIKDEFRGDDAHLCESIKALIQLSDRGVLSTKLGGHARTLLAASYRRLKPKKVKAKAACRHDAGHELNGAGMWICKGCRADITPDATDG